jgi:hypothetical protein
LQYNKPLKRSDRAKIQNDRDTDEFPKRAELVCTSRSA